MKKMSITALALAVALSAQPVGAQHFTPSQASVSYGIIGVGMSLVVLTAPVWMTAAGVQKAHAGSEARREAKADAKAKAKAAKAGPLPPLTVTGVTPLDGGGFEVALQNPQEPDAPAVVQWPAAAGQGEAQIAVGDVLDFTPTAAGAGWTVQAADGTALAYLPTEDAAADAVSERW